MNKSQTVKSFVKSVRMKTNLKEYIEKLAKEKRWSFSQSAVVLLEIGIKEHEKEK
jgi:hypothetical protein